MFTSHGKIVYDPKRSMKKNTKNWCVLELKNDEIARYYRHQIDVNWWQADTHNLKRSYSKPPHKAHVSIIRGERLWQNEDDWGFLNGKVIPFKYSHMVRQTNKERDGKDHFWFVDVVFPEFNKIRAYYGLQTERDGVPFKGHLTVARVH